MNVRELIEVLQTLDPEAVVVTTDCCYGPDTLTEDQIEATAMRIYDAARPVEGLPTPQNIGYIYDEEFDLDLEDFPNVRKFSAVILR